ncbi:alpha/beta-hydrolase lipase region domain-containing protein [Phthorimaea operculella]|nr:alpha/beta-hydrolase lipase region domain-containing protein [Phthorimaea operculella]
MALLKLFSIIFLAISCQASYSLVCGKVLYNVPDSYLDISQLVEKNGFPFERHFVTTEDGYILQLHRIPGKGPVVFLNHGIVSSSVDFVVGGANGSLAFYLARRGYDVWIGNARGNRFSRRNLYISPADQPQFFNFSWHEIGIYDLPATIDYILELTGETVLNFVGHSQGTTTFYVLCSLLSEYNKKIKVHISLTPIAFLSHLFSPVIRLSYILQLFGILMGAGWYDMLSNPTPIYTFCNNNNIFKFICITGLSLAAGYDRGELNYANFPVILNHNFAGSSVKQAQHYGQSMYSGKFRQYDYGKAGNLELYGSVEPPDYPLHKVTAPVVLSYSFSDYVSSVLDVEKLKKRLSACPR